MLGSPNHTPPEQAARKRGQVGKRSDIYSLRPILYHVLIGRAPFHGESRDNIARLNGDGTLDNSFQNGMAGANSDVFSVAVQSEGKVLIGGDFDTIND